MSTLLLGVCIYQELASMPRVATERVEAQHQTAQVNRTLFGLTNREWNSMGNLTSSRPAVCSIANTQLFSRTDHFVEFIPHCTITFRNGVFKAQAVRVIWPPSIAKIHV